MAQDLSSLTGNAQTTAGNGSSNTTDPGQETALQVLGPYLMNLIQSGSIPPDLQITPAITAEFLSMAHAVVDPQTQQYIENTVSDINANTQEFQTAFQQAQLGIQQQYGSQLATEQNASGAAGIAYGGERRGIENLMTSEANLQMQQAANQYQQQEGANLRAGAAAIGTPNAGLLQQPNTPSYNSLTNVGGSGPQLGSVLQGGGGGLNYNYNPMNYAVGSLLTQGNTNVNQTAANFNQQYGTLAANPINSGQTAASLIGSIQSASATPTSSSLQ